MCTMHTRRMRMYAMLHVRVPCAYMHAFIYVFAHACVCVCMHVCVDA